jgi:hypothetical protein
VAVAPHADADLPFLEKAFGAPVGRAILDGALCFGNSFGLCDRRAALFFDSRRSLSLG